MAESYESLRASGLAALAAGDARKAFSVFRWALEYPGKAPDRAGFQDALEVFGQIAQAIAGEDFAGRVRAAARDPDDAQALYDLGYELIEQSLHGIAATVLARAWEEEPSSGPILAELVCALEGADLHREAYRLLRGATALVEEHFMVRYLLAFNALMSCDRDEATRQLPALERALRKEDDPDGNFAFMFRRMQRMVARAAGVAGATSLDERDLRGWHFVTTGTLLLHISPYGFDEGMNGRYAFTQDSEERCLEGLQRLAAVQEAWKRPPARVFALPDRDSAALAHAAARHLGVPVEAWPEGGSSKPGLITAYDLAALEGPVLASIQLHRQGQLLFSQAASWTDEAPFAADVTTYLYQMNTSPWEARKGVDPETRQLIDLPRAAGAPEELAEAVVSAKLDKEDSSLADLPALLRLAEAIAKLPPDAAGGAFRAGEKRGPQWRDSPVKSSRFL